MRSKRIIITVALIIVVAILAVFALQARKNQTKSAAPKVAAISFAGQDEVVRGAIDWMVSKFQNDDGGYASFSGGANQAPSAIAETLDVVLALAAAGHDPAMTFDGQESSPLVFLRANGEALASYAQVDGGQAGKVVLALTAASVDPRDFAGQDYVALITKQYDQAGGFGAGDTFKQANAMLGLAAAGEPIPAPAIDWLESKQAADGSWDDGFGTASNADATAIAIMALLAAGRTSADAPIQSAKAFLSSSQQPAGWEYGPGFGPNANSTSLVIQALSGLGEDWYSDASPWTKDGQTALQALLAFRGTSGAFQSDFGQGPFDDFYATVQAIPTVAGQWLPLSVKFDTAHHILFWLGI